MIKVIVNGEVYKDKFIEMNSYIIDYKGKCFIVDPGYEKEKIRKAVEENNLEVLGIILTHSHLDHISALDVYNVPIYVSSREYPLFMYNYNDLYNERGLSRNYSLDGRTIIQLKEGESIPFLDKEIQVIWTPGHTCGGVCYKFENEIFSGDTLFKGLVGRSDLKTGNIEELKTSIVSLIDSQDDSILAHPAHMDSTTIGNERHFNPYYKAWK